MVRTHAAVLLAALTLGWAGAGSGCALPAEVEAAPIEPPVVLADGIERRDVRFACGDGTCAGWLYLPPAAAPPPAVVLGHGFAGTRDLALPDVALRLAGAGLAALAIDYRHFGASSGSPRQLVDPWRQLEDWAGAIAWLRAKPELDGGRIGLFGTSLGGGHALVTAAADGRVGAVVAQAPLIDTGLEGEATFYGVGWAARLLLSAWRDLARGALGRPALEIPAIAPAGGFGMIVDDAAFAAFERLTQQPSSYRNAVAARSVLTFDEYDPSARAGEIRAPVLLVASRTDRFAPFAAVRAFADRVPGTTVETFDGDHFDVYDAPARERAAGLAAEFLTRHLRDGGAPR